MSKSFVGAYWGPRAESVDESADRLSRLVSALAMLEPTLRDWRNKGGSKRQALAQPLVTAHHADLVQRLLAGQHRTNLGQEIIDDVGYSVHWWNGVDNSRDGATLSLHIASTTLSNSLVIKLPGQDAAPGLYKRMTAQTLLERIVQILCPDRAVFSSDSLLDKQSEPDRHLEDGGFILGKLVGHPAGWANFLGDSDSTKFDPTLLPSAATVERLGHGTLVTLRTDPANPSLSDVLQVRRAMGYPVSTQQAEPSDDMGAATAGPPITAVAPERLVEPAEERQTDPRRGNQTHSVPHPARGTDSQSRDTRRGTPHNK